MAVENGINTTLDKTEEFFKSIKTLTNYQVLVGVPAGSTRSDSMSNAALAYIHEFGSPARNIPARPFLNPAVNRLKDKAAAMLKQAAQFHLDHKDGEAKNTLTALGTLAVNNIKADIVGGGDPKFVPLSPVTVARKGSDSPLIDTGQLLNSITFVIRKKG